MSICTKTFTIWSTDTDKVEEVFLLPWTRTTTNPDEHLLHFETVYKEYMYLSFFVFRHCFLTHIQILHYILSTTSVTNCRFFVISTGSVCIQKKISHSKITSMELGDFHQWATANRCLSTCSLVLHFNIRWRK